MDRLHPLNCTTGLCTPIDLSSDVLTPLRYRYPSTRVRNSKSTSRSRLTSAWNTALSMGALGLGVWGLHENGVIDLSNWIPSMGTVQSYAHCACNVVNNAGKWAVSAVETVKSIVGTACGSAHAVPAG